MVKCGAGFILTVLFSYTILAAHSTVEDELAKAVEQLRHSIGRWSVVTEFLNEDKTILRKVTGNYQFEWIVPDRVVSGRSDIPELNRSSGILFYINEQKKTIEMVSVGADGQLWVMTGDIGKEIRYSQLFKSSEGKESQLRFTRYNVSKDAFESIMEYTEDGGKTWKPGNHQVFKRQKSDTENQ